MAAPLCLPLFYFDQNLGFQCLFACLAIAVLPQWKLPIIAIASLISLTNLSSVQFLHLLVPDNGVIEHFLFMVFVGVVGLVMVFLRFRAGDKPQRPSLYIGLAIVLYFAIIEHLRVAHAHPWLTALLLGVAVGIVRYVWYFAYDLQSKAQSPRRFSIFRLAFYRPFWSWYFVAPIPKGESYWRRIEVSAPSDLGLLRSKAMGLMYWGFALHFLMIGSKELFGEVSVIGVTLHVRPILESLQLIEAGRALSVLDVWTSVLWDFWVNLLLFASRGHMIVAVVWFAGYQCERNTRAPLLAKSPIDFFQRYNYFYKELLFQIFFFPTFLRLKGLPAKVRIALALLIAVGLGNFLVIFLRNTELHFTLGFGASFIELSNYLVYALLLTVMLLPSTVTSLQGGPGPLRISATRKVFSVAMTVAGFAAIRIFEEDHHGRMLASWKMFGALFGLG